MSKKFGIGKSSIMALFVARRCISSSKRKADGMDCRHCRDDDAADRKPVNQASIARPRADFRRGGNRYQPGQEALSRRSRACCRKRKNRTPKTKKSGRLQSSVDLDHHRQRASCEDKTERMDANRPFAAKVEAKSRCAVRATDKDIA
ncbi:MAG: hypothetical protein ISN26_01190 [Betaproteobacteria bacterium AqS2]|uniref:Uncharacterized protein n=1 Tax=Candidatus Amphirhobacter heronislandensis TaxID=1732024 RepID=A0A930XW45_9GAMM|nr:hypothetical protein [Betaproteobacteria bacterium AqS2]